MSKLLTQTPSVMHQVDGILAVHEFHIWQLAGDRIIASAHVSWESSTLVLAHLGKKPKLNFCGVFHKFLNFAGALSEPGAVHDSG